MSDTEPELATLRKKSWQRLIFLAVAYVFLVGYFLTVFGEIERNADNTGNCYAGVDWFRGNWNLHGWVLPPDNFMNSDLLLYGILSKLFGVKVEICHYSAALIWSAVVLLAGLLVGRDPDVQRRRWVFLAAGTTLFVPVIRGNPELGLISMSPLHIGSIVYLLACYFCADLFLRSEGLRSRLALLIYFVCLSLDVFADPMIVVLGVLPILATLTLCLFLCKFSSRRLLMLGLVTVLALLVGKILLHLLKADGFKSPPLPISFAPFKDFGLNVRIVTHALFVFAGAEFWGQSITKDTIWVVILLLLHLPLLVFQVFAFGQLTTKLAAQVEKAAQTGEAEVGPVEAEGLFLPLVLYFSTLFNLGAGLFSSSMQDMGHLRYLLIGFVCWNIAFARYCAQWVVFRRYIALCFAASCLYAVCCYVPRIGKEPVLIDRNLTGVCARLLQMGLKHGFSYYWDSTTSTLRCQEQLFTRPVVNGLEDKLYPYVWTANCYWFDVKTFDAPRFYVLTRRPEKPDYITAEQAIRTFGQPEEQFELFGFVILIYDTEKCRSVLEGFEQHAHTVYKNY